MADAKSPTICVTCQQSLPDDLTPEAAPKFLAQQHLLPRSDDVDDFICQASVINEYIRTVSYVTRYAQEMEEAEYITILDLLRELGEEEQRRLELARDALKELWEREQEAKKAPHARNEGRA